MRLVLSIYFLVVCSSLWGSETCFNDAKLSLEKVVNCINGQESLEPKWDSKSRCEHCQLVGGAKSCKVGQFELVSCQTPPQAISFYCFDGMVLYQDSANLSLMNFLCHDEEFPAEVRLQFGSCEIGQKIETEKITCYCQFQNADKSMPLAFHCQSN